MEREIVIEAGSVVVKGVMKDTPLAEKIYNQLPFTSKARLWGKEIYFEIPVSSGIDNPVEEVEKGDIGYWPEGRCLCLFFGPTPISKGEKPIPASAVEVVGKITSDYTELEKVRSGENISVEGKS
ncbi:MAG: cyclophilin-like fold protein [Candidatus Omnitrophica bacterium]|nr:cyclophilin-like fold protein [Candidatus Omnitrophota bacterium]